MPYPQMQWKCTRQRQACLQPGRPAALPAQPRGSRTGSAAQSAGRASPAGRSGRPRALRPAWRLMNARKRQCFSSHEGSGTHTRRRQRRYRHRSPRSRLQSRGSVAADGRILRQHPRKQLRIRSPPARPLSPHRHTDTPTHRHTDTPTHIQAHTRPARL